jgi:hypothetical protein
MTTFYHIHKRNEVRFTFPKTWPMSGSIGEEVTWRGNFRVFPGHISRDYWKNPLQKTYPPIVAEIFLVLGTVWEGVET